MHVCAHPAIRNQGTGNYKGEPCRRDKAGALNFLPPMAPAAMRHIAQQNFPTFFLDLKFHGIPRILPCLKLLQRRAGVNYVRDVTYGERTRHAARAATDASMDVTM